MINLPSNFKLISKFITGSRLYGTNTELSDTDIRGVFIPSEEYFYGFLNRIEQIKDNETDTEFYDIRKFLVLTLDNNPNIIEFLFIPDKFILHKTKEWDDIVSNRSYFVSKKCRHTFFGYANSQLKRIQRHRSWLLNPPKKHPQRSDYGLPGNKSLLSKDQIGAFNTLVSLYLKQIGKHHKLAVELEEMEENVSYISVVQNLVNIDYNAVSKIMKISDNMIEALDREKAYANAIAHWNAYQNWKKNRNPKRAKFEKKFGYDTKHAAHLLRLITECKELLTTKRLTFPRPDSDFLLSVRNGSMTYDELLDYISGFESDIDEIDDKSELPKQPNRKAIDNLCIQMVKTTLRGNNEKQTKKNK